MCDLANRSLNFRDLKHDPVSSRQYSTDSGEISEIAVIICQIQNKIWRIQEMICRIQDNISEIQVRFLR